MEREERPSGTLTFRLEVPILLVAVYIHSCVQGACLSPDGSDRLAKATADLIVIVALAFLLRGLYWVVIKVGNRFGPKA